MSPSVPRTLKDLPPAWARFCLGLETFVSRELGVDLQGQRLLLGLSAGVDSTALLLWARVMQNRWRARIQAAHLHHGLRSQADQEEQAVLELGHRASVRVHTGHTSVPTYAKSQGLGPEEAGRTLRYRFLQGTARHIQADLVLLAHHLNDLAEDMLMRQIRGAGWPALAGMAAWEPDSSLLRPFLLTPKRQLIEFVHVCGLDWMEDASNPDLRFTRNRVRHQILPLLVSENPNFLHQTASLWRQAQVDAEFWQDELQDYRGLEQIAPQGILLPAERLLSLHRAQRLRWYRDVLARLGPGQTLASTLFQLDRAWQGQSWNKRFQFPGGKEVVVLRQGLLCQGPISASAAPPAY